MDREPKQHFFESQRMRLSYWDWGNEQAPPLMLVHGGLDEARSWDRIARPLSAEYHVVALDLRGHGDSQWSPGSQYAIPDFALDVARLAEMLCPPVRVVSHSLGASTCLVAAGTFPDLFAAIVAIEGTHTLNPPEAKDGMGPGWLRAWATVMREFEAAKPHVYGTREEMVERLARSNPTQPREWLVHLTEHDSRAVDGGYMWKFDPWGRSRMSMEIREHELEHFWAEIACPVLLIFAERQNARPQRLDAAPLFLNARSIVVEDAGHSVQHDQPERMIKEIRDFFANG